MRAIKIIYKVEHEKKHKRYIEDVYEAFDEEAPAEKERTNLESK